MLREGSWLRIMPRAAPGPCGVMPQAGRRRAGHTMAAMEKVRISKLMSERGLCSRREADGYIERGWVRVDGVVVSELGARAFPDQVITLERAAQAPDLARHDTDQQAGGLCVRPGREGLYPGRGADRRAFALRRRPRAAALRARPSGRPGRGRPAGHRFPGPAGADAGRSHRQAADRRGFRGRQGIPGARAGQPVGSRPRTVESRPVAGRQALRPAGALAATSCASCCARARSVRSAACASWSASRWWA